MGIRRRGAIALALLAAGLPALAAFAQTTPFTIYDNEFKSGWQNWSWAKVETPSVAAGMKPLKVHGDGWTALALHHEPFSTAQFTKLTFYIHGGPDGGQRLTVKVMADGKALDSNYVIEPKAKTWAVVEVALKDLSAENRTIDGLMLQADGTPYKPYFITKMQFE